MSLFHRLGPRALKTILNLYAPYLGAGVVVRCIDPQWREVQVELLLRWYNRNAVGTQFGGSLYSMVDPHLMLLLMKRLGPDYVVWDQSASIEFLRPGKGKVCCTIAVEDSQVEAIRKEAEGGSVVRPEFQLDITDESQNIVARVAKKLYVRKTLA